MVDDAKSQKKQNQGAPDDFVSDFPGRDSLSFQAIHREHDVDTHYEHEPGENKVGHGQTWNGTNVSNMHSRAVQK